MRDKGRLKNLLWNETEVGFIVKDLVNYKHTLNICSVYQCVCLCERERLYECVGKRERKRYFACRSVCARALLSCVLRDILCSLKEKH